jgi:alkylhydroperoxidase family enzyme
MGSSHAGIVPAAIDALDGVQRTASEVELDPSLVELLRMRTSQLNGCALSPGRPAKGDLREGEVARGLHEGGGWRRGFRYTERERAALAWCESLTLLPSSNSVAQLPATRPPDEVLEELTGHFSSEEIAALTLEVIAMNGLSRLATALRAPISDYVPSRRPLQAD